jgi:hypothetical protein
VQLQKRITTSTTIAATPQSGLVSQIVIAVDNAGTTWTLRIEDNSSPVIVIFPTATLALSNSGPLIIKFDKPIRVTNGIDIITTGTPGIVCVLIEFQP